MTRGTDFVTNTIYRKNGTDDQDRLPLNKREYFAGLAMQNLQNVLLRKSGETKLEAWKKELELLTEDVIASLAVAQADALIDALNADTDK